MARRAVVLTLALPFLTLAACEQAAESAAETGAQAVLPGKADNYLSPTAREYTLWGMDDFTLEADPAIATYEAREARARELVGYRLKADTHFINAYVTDKSSHDDNAGYGGFAGLVRSTSLDFVMEPLDDEGLAWVFLWELEMGGPRDMMDRLPLETNDEGAYFMVTMPVLTEWQLENASYPKSFDPATFSGETVDFMVMVEAEEASPDAWPEFGDLFADGVVEILVLVGGDYNEARYDQKSAEAIFAWLKDAHWEHPAEVLADVKLDSPPFEKTLKAGGETVRLALTFLYPDIVEDADLDRLGARVREAYETMDVLIYDGHAGQDPSYSGLVYHYNPRKAVPANDLGTMALPGHYQIFVMNGCKTYSAYPEAAYANPDKTTKNLDIISTVSFSWLTMQPYTTSGFLNELFAVRAGQHEPRSFEEILTTINQSNNHNVYYGVHGLEDNPHANPYADAATLCQACDSDGDCPGAGNLCVGFDWGRVCGVECTSDDGCPADYVCGEIAAGGAISGRQCLPRSYTCE